MIAVRVQLWLFFRKQKSLNRKYFHPFNCLIRVPLCNKSLINPILYNQFTSKSNLFCRISSFTVLLLVHLSVTNDTVKKITYMFTISQLLDLSDSELIFLTDIILMKHKHNSATAINGVPQGSVHGLLFFFFYMPTIAISHFLSQNLALLLDWPIKCYH